MANTGRPKKTPAATSTKKASPAPKAEEAVKEPVKAEVVDVVEDTPIKKDEVKVDVVSNEEVKDEPVEQVVEPKEKNPRKCGKCAMVYGSAFCSSCDLFDEDNKGDK